MLKTAVLKDNVLRNPVTGDVVTLFDPLPRSPGDALVFTTLLPPGAAGSPPHRHARLTETFEVLEGSVEFRIGAATRSLPAGETVTIRPSRIHGFRNASAAPALLKCTVTHGARFARFLQGLQTAAETGAATAAGLPRDPRRLARLLLDADFHFPVLPMGLQRALFRALAALASCSLTLRPKATPMTTRSPLLGVSAIAMAIGFNLPYANLAAIYDYPDILRRPAAAALARFADGGAALILTWHAFAWAALLLVPLTLALSLTPRNLATAPRLALAAAITGALSGVAQAIGLWRWVFVIPGLARAHAEGDAAARAAAEGAFDILNAYGGVAIGEHLGQWLLVFFTLALAAVQWRQGARATAIAGFATAAAIAVGTTEGLALALGRDGEVFALFTIAGFLGLTLWLVLTGIGLLRKAGTARTAPRPAR
jgi:quercetin dioxygenase-like cupin family protein